MRHWAPGLIGQDGVGQSFVARQPESAEEEQAMWRAAVACPTQSIRNGEAKRPTGAVFPHELGADRYAAEMQQLGPALRQRGQVAWSERPGTTFDWY